MFGKPRRGDILRNVVEIFPGLEGDNQNAGIISFPDNGAAAKPGIFCPEHSLECRNRARKRNPVRGFLQREVIFNGMPS
ncbi:MAG: hypothetical protein P8164_02020 [Gammaproteobacteria bacterium]